MNQQQSSNTTKKDIILQLLQSGVLKQRNLNDKISHEEISRLINDIISSSEDNTGELRRSKRDMGKGIYYSVIFMYRAYRLVDKLGWKRGLQVVNRYLGIKRGQEQTLETARELLGDIEDIEDLKDFIDDLKQILSTETGKEQVIEEYSNTSLHLAAKQGNLNAVKYFVEKGGDISSQNEMGYTPLHLAAKQGNLDIVKYLVEKGADVDVYQGGWSYSTALHLAARKGHLDTVKYLIEKGANPKAIDSDGKTPLQRANEKGLSDIVEYLAKKVQQVTEVPQVTEDYSNTSLHLAAEQGNLNAVKYLVEKGADINAKTNGDDTPLYKAAYNGHLDVVKYLESKGARRSRRSIESKDLSQPINGTSKLPLWMSSIVNWVKGSTEAPALLTSREHNNHTVIAIPEINTAVVNNTLMLGILATSLFNKT